MGQRGARKTKEDSNMTMTSFVSSFWSSGRPRPLSALLFTPPFYSLFNCLNDRHTAINKLVVLTTLENGGNFGASQKHIWNLSNSSSPKVIVLSESSVPRWRCDHGFKVNDEGVCAVDGIAFRRRYGVIGIGGHDGHDASQPTSANPCNRCGSARLRGE
jgi:hypothetical protein